MKTLRETIKNLQEFRERENTLDIKCCIISRFDESIDIAMNTILKAKGVNL